MNLPDALKAVAAEMRRLAALDRASALESRRLAARLGGKNEAYNELCRDAAQYEQSAWRLEQLADRIEARCTTARVQAQRLTPLVLAKAFRGELVPQDPSDEPASALLARIASADIAVAGKSKRKVPAVCKERA